MANIKKTGKNVGDTIILKNEHKSLVGTFEKGTEVKILSKGPRGYDIIDEFGNKMYECGWDLQKGYSMITKVELQEIGKEIINKQRELIEKNQDKWERGQYTKAEAWEDAIKEICLLR